MDNDVLQIILRARDEASAVVKNLGDTLDQTSKQAQNMSAAFKIAGGIVTAVGVAGVLAMKSWLDAGVQAQTETIKTNTLLSQLASQSGTAFNVLRNSADMVSNKMLDLGFDAETSSLSFAKLLGATKTVADANKAMTVTADLARFGNMSLDDATTAVTRAYEGNTRALKALGIEVPKGAKGMEVLGLLQDRLAGQADNFANSYAGLQARLSASSTELKEKLGTALLPMFDKLADKLGSVITWLNKLDPNVIKTAAMVTLAGTAFALVVGPFLLFIGFLPAIAAGFGTIAAVGLPVIAILAGVALVAYGAYEAFTHWGQITAFLTVIWNNVKTIFANIMKVIDDFVTKNQNTFNALKIIVTTIFNDLMIFFKAYWDYIVLVFDVALAIITGIWNATWQTIVQVLKDIWEIIKGVIQVAWGIIEIFINVGMAILTGNWSKAWAGIKDGLYDIWEGIKGIVSGAVAMITDSVKLALNGIIGFINGVISGANSVVDKIPGAKGIKIPLIPTFMQGGYVPQTGLALLHQGEFVLSKDMLQGRQNIPSSVETTNNNSPVTIYATINQDMDLNLLGQKVAFAVRNSR